MKLSDSTLASRGIRDFGPSGGRGRNRTAIVGHSCTLARSPLVTDPDSDRGGSRGPGGLKPPTPANQREKESAPAA